MLAFDIETTGLGEADTITAACAFDPSRNIERTFIFSQGGDPHEFIALLDEADVLCAFNGVRFDIPFMQKEWKLSDSRVHVWVAKLVDVYEMAMLVFRRGFSLNQLLIANKIDVKTGTGKEAIELAHRGAWAELGEYCMQDTKKTHAVTSLAKIITPLSFPTYKVELHNLCFRMVET